MKIQTMYKCESCNSVQEDNVFTKCDTCGKEICPNCWLIRNTNHLCSKCYGGKYYYIEKSILRKM